MTIKTEEEIQIMYKGGQILAGIRKELVAMARPGTTTNDLEKHFRKRLKEEGVSPAFLNYRGYPAGLCTSINDQVVHCPPSNRALKMGDILSIDMGLIYEGWYLDTAVTIGVGKISPEAQKLIDVTKRSLKDGIAKIKPGRTLGEISHAIQQYAETHGYGVVRDLVGHGIGKQLHEDPAVPNYGKKGDGPILKEGMVLAIEPMLTEGDWNVIEDDDGFTFRTADGKLSAHFEHSVAITKDGPLVLTK